MKAISDESIFSITRANSSALLPKKTSAYQIWGFKLVALYGRGKTNVPFFFEMKDGDRFFLRTSVVIWLSRRNGFTATLDTKDKVPDRQTFLGILVRGSTISSSESSSLTGCLLLTLTNWSLFFL